MICGQKRVCSFVYIVTYYSPRNIMVVIQYYICVFLYASQMSKFTYSKVIGSLKPNSNLDPAECLPADSPLCSQYKHPDELILSVQESGPGGFTVWLPLLIFGVDVNSDAINNIDEELQNEEEGENEMEIYVSGKRFPNRMIRSLELTEEYPPEAPTAPSIPQPPTENTPTEPKNRNTGTTTSDVTTISPEVELIDTTTEDYGNVGEPNCDYDPITFILKCGLNIITSIFGVSDTCCKPLF
ncbi:Hypothetical protein CINCED_3A007102 [Cinara cedri]|uniref:Uncharacterized protein n=1 Tax=Cinara cedri TaxID=506608 RepID=A0A5E4N3E4_9HEMI|nr:Hypothetical protein CINCED_3A007102 [Cinara cedri]